MNTSLQIRPATASDLDGVADVWRDSAAAMDGTPPDLPTATNCARVSIASWRPAGIYI